MKALNFESFLPSSKKEWMQQVHQDLQGKDFEATLTSVNSDGIRIQPYYTQADSVNGLEGYRNAFHPAPDIPGLPPRVWHNVATFEVEDEKASNLEILQALMNGVDGILLKIKGHVDYGILLKHVGIPYVKVYLEPKVNVVEAWENFKTWVESIGIEQGELRGGILWDGYSETLRSRLDRQSLQMQASALLISASGFPNFRPISIKFSTYHQAGASAVQELAYGFAALVALLDDLEAVGILPGEVFSNSIVCTEAGGDFFGEIAKIKALRAFFHQLALLYGTAIGPEMVEILVGTSYWTKARWDVHTNLLRNTSEAMAAIFGGCNALMVGTHDFSNTAFSTRMARNISNILREESFLDKVIDPAAGSYYVDVLVRSYLEKAKSKLMKIDEAGGWWKAYETSVMQCEIREARQQQMLAVCEGKSTKVGVNKYALHDHRLIVALPKEETWQLLPWRETLLFESQNQPEL
jgi:methylmalonyl-CoA mutase